MTVHFGKLTPTQQNDARILMDTLRVVPGKDEYQNSTMVQSWDLYTRAGETDAVRDFEEAQIARLKQCIQDANNDRLSVLGRIRTFLEATQAATDYIPSDDLWKDFVKLATRQINRQQKAISRHLQEHFVAGRLHDATAADFELVA